jgi:hypothetical protein
MNFQKVKIITSVPHEDADRMRSVFGGAGAGRIGEYMYCSYTITGKARFLPQADADPEVGESGDMQTVEEEYIEVVCDFTAAKNIVSAVRKAHPYEEPVIQVVPLIDESQL